MAQAELLALQASAKMTYCRKYFAVPRIQVSKDVWPNARRGAAAAPDDGRGARIPALGGGQHQPVGQEP
jgi:hypothetical protein